MKKRRKAVQGIKNNDFINKKLNTERSSEA